MIEAGSLVGCANTSYSILLYRNVLDVSLEDGIESVADVSDFVDPNNFTALVIKGINDHGGCFNEVFVLTTCGRIGYIASARLIVLQHPGSP